MVDLHDFGGSGAGFAAIPDQFLNGSNRFCEIMVRADYGATCLYFSTGP